MNQGQWSCGEMEGDKKGLSGTGGDSAIVLGIDGLVTAFLEID